VKIGVALSGGVDSTVAAHLLQAAGHEVVGVTMTLGRSDEEASLAETRAVAERLAIPLQVVDLSAAWRAEVLRYIRETYLAGETPNPCVRCNELVKFGLLPRRAFDLGCELFATGHYARREGTSTADVRLLRGVDRTKDQSYFLYRVDREILARTVFPLGGLTKAQVREQARALGLAVAEKGDSQDFCGGDPMEIVAAEPSEGNIVTTDGRVLGRHRGYWNYTIGKRKGLGIGGGVPYYVVALRAATNEVVVGTREEVEVREFRIRASVRLGAGAVDPDEPLTVKVRSAGEPHGPVFWRGETVSCPEGISGVAPGQSAVFYRGDEIVGGAVIDSLKR